MAKDWKSEATHLDKRMAALFKAAPKPMQGFQSLMGAASASGQLDTKTKELMALAIAITQHCEGCITFHTRQAIGHGASREECAEAIAVAVEMGGGPAVVYGAQALEAYDDLSS